MNRIVVFLLAFACESSFAGTPYDVGVLDTGIVENDSLSLSRLRSQFCISLSDQSSGGTPSRLSTCQNRQTTSNSSLVPRRYRYTVSTPSGTQFVNGVAGDRHGSDVLVGVRQIDPNIRYVVGNISYCERAEGATVDPNCGILFTDGDFNLGRSLDIRRIGISSSLLSTVLNRSSRLGAINISYGSRTHTTCPSTLSGTFFDLKNIHKAPVVAATGNGGDRSKPAFPACATDVISVAATQRQTQASLPPLISSTAVWDANTDFFAEGHLVTYDGDSDHDLDGIPNSQEVGSSYAAPRVSAAIATLRGENALASIDDIKQALASASFALGLDVNACRSNGSCRKFPFVSRAVVAKAKQIIRENSTVPVEPDPIELDIELPKLFGWDYQGTSNKFGFALNFTTSSPQAIVLGKSSADLEGATIDASEVFSKASVDSYLLTFDGYDIDYDGEIKVFLNGEFAANVGRGSNNSFKGYSITLPANLVKGGENTLEFRVDQAPSKWAIRNILLKEVPSFPDLPSSDDRVIGDNGPYGDAYSRETVSEVPISFSFSTQKPTTSTYNKPSVRRDLRVRFTTKSGDTSSTKNGTIVRLNGSTILTTESFFGDERSFEVIVNRNSLNAAGNTILFRPKETDDADKWGIRGISIEYIEPISLNLGATNSNEYGYSSSTTRYTGLRANFSVPAVENDYRLSLIGWDIDAADETEIFINGHSLGFLAEGNSSAYNSGDTFVLSKSRLKQGNNQIELVQKYPDAGWQGFQDEKWAAKDFKVSILKPDLRVSSVRILEPRLIAGSSFSVKTEVSNIGAGSSSASIVRFYVSTDSAVTSSDTLIGSVSVSSISAGGKKILEKSLISSFVNSGQYLGACVDAVPNEISTSNNCSKGIKLSDRVSIAPIIMLLLGD